MQFLPEIRSIIDITGNISNYHEEIDTSEQASDEWKDYLNITDKIDKLVNQQKEKVINEFHNLKEPLKDSLYSKKNNDRVWCAYVSCLATNENPEKYIETLFPFELIDYSIILLDDVTDDAEKRGTGLAHYKKWGISTTLNVSELLKSSALELIVNSSLDDNKKIKILDELQDMQKKIYKGQQFDIELEGKNIEDVTKQDYINLVSLTTGYQGRNLFRIGAILSNANIDVVDSLGECGLNLGVLCQMRDDLIDYIPDQNLIWKTPYLDFIKNKKRLPLIIGWKNANYEEKEKLTNLQKKEILTNEDYLTISNILFKPENLEKIKKEMYEFKDKGINILNDNKLNLNYEGKKMLETVFKFEAGDKI